MRSENPAAGGDQLPLPQPGGTGRALSGPRQGAEEEEEEEAMAEVAQHQAQAQEAAAAAAAAAAGSSSEDFVGAPAAAAEEGPGVPAGVSDVREKEEEEEEEEDNVVSEATSVSSGDSGGGGPQTPSANGYPGPRSGREPRATVGELVDGGGGGRESGQDRLSATQAPSPEWHECPECGRGFGTSRALKVHRSYHVGRKRPHSGSSATAKPPALLPPLPPLVLPGNPPESQDGRTAPAPSGRGRAFHYICAECGLGFASPSTLEGHRCEHGWRRSPPAPLLPRHKSPSSPAATEANGEQDADGTDGPYHCTECSGEFGLVSELHEHYILHARGEL